MTDVNLLLHEDPGAVGKEDYFNSSFGQGRM